MTDFEDGNFFDGDYSILISFLLFPNTDILIINIFLIPLIINIAILTIKLSL